MLFINFNRQLVTANRLKRIDGIIYENQKPFITVRFPGKIKKNDVLVAAKTIYA